MEDRSSNEKKHPEGPEDTLTHNIYDRLLSRWFHTHHSRVIVGNSIIVLILVFSIVLGAATICFDIHSEKLKAFGYVGIFILNLISTSTFFIPVPGLTAAGQALIVSEAPRLGAWQVGLIGGLGMALGEITAYVAGAAGREVARGRQVGGPGWFRNAVNKTTQAHWLADAAIRDGHAVRAVGRAESDLRDSGTYGRCRPHELLAIPRVGYGGEDTAWPGASVHRRVLLSRLRPLATANDSPHVNGSVTMAARWP